MVIDIERAGGFLAVGHQLPELLVHHVEAQAVRHGGRLTVAHFLHPYLMVIDKLQHLPLRQGALLGVHQPQGQAHPTVFTGLDASCTLNHAQPLVRSGLVLKDALHSAAGIADKDRSSGPGVLTHGLLGKDTLGSGYIGIHPDTGLTHTFNEGVTEKGIAGKDILHVLH